MDKYSFLNAAHTAYFADLYDQYLMNPDTVEPSWRAFFQGYDFGSENSEWNEEKCRRCFSKFQSMFIKSFK